MDKKVVAVLFGGVAVEHDVSILTGLQIIEAMDTTKYVAIPIYIDQQGKWWSGKELLDRKNYHFSRKTKNKLQQLELSVGYVFNERPFFNIKSKNILLGNKKIYFDIALLAFHGDFGEDGHIQGIFENAKIPYTGTRLLASAVYMNKIVAKKLFKSIGIPVLPDIILKKPTNINILDINKITKDLEISFPVCAKPCNLGSSVGVYKVENQQELHTAILNIFKIDKEIIIEPFVENLVEYDVSVTKALNEETTLSAIEKPIRDSSLLNFNDKYLSQGGIETKLSMSITEGMASATRVLHPEDLSKKQEQIIIDSATKAFEIVGGCGAPRLDFLCNEKTKEIWLNEINPLPGALAYYLWEARTPKINFTKLVDALIKEGFLEHKKAYKTFSLHDIQSSIFPVRN
jgi:D-alanine-D-alanine ligase